jgi:hypothetical protein
MCWYHEAAAGLQVLPPPRNFQVRINSMQKRALLVEVFVFLAVGDAGAAAQPIAARRRSSVASNNATQTATTPTATTPTATTPTAYIVPAATHQIFSMKVQTFLLKIMTPSPADAEARRVCHFPRVAETRVLAASVEEFAGPQRRVQLGIGHDLARRHPAGKMHRHELPGMIEAHG